MSDEKRRQDNMPKELFSPRVTQQKLDYIHNNPVEAGIVENPEDYLFSSEKVYVRRKRIIKSRRDIKQSLKWQVATQRSS
jgi:hypothetical protein